MSWELVVGFNFVIAGCYVVISSLILTGLARTRQLRSNKLACATALIFATCAVHHWAHALHLLVPEGGGGQAGLEATRQTYSGIHNVLIEVVGAAVALTYLGLRRYYKVLLSTPAMFDDAVRAATEKQLTAMAFNDLVTDVPNRAAYQAYADSLVRDTRPVAVLFIDLDKFKEVNDVHGHEAGDRVLRDVAQRVQNGLGPDERLFRIGGDEFVVVAVGVEGAAVEALVGRVTDLVTSVPVTVRGGPVPVTASIGVACGRNGLHVDRLLRQADLAMYEVKSSRHAPQAMTES